MKKFILGVFAFALFIGTNTAQTPAADLIKKASKAVKNIAGKKEKLAEAQTAIDAMMADAANKTSWDALLWKGKMYNEMASIDNLERSKNQLLGKPYKAEYTKSGLMAADALLASLKATQDKKQIKEVTAALAEAQSSVNNYGSDLTDAKDYVGAYNSFKAVIDIHDALKANGVKSTLDKVEDYNKQLYLIALLSTYSEKEKKGINKVFLVALVVGVVIIAVPVIIVHSPVPGAGALPARVKFELLHCV